MKQHINDIEYIQYVFSMSMSDIAFLLGQTRTTICTYKEDKCPSETTKLNLKRLVEIAEIFDKANVERISYFMHREIKPGQTLLEYIKELTCKVFIDSNEISLIIKQILEQEVHEKQQRAKQKGSGKNLRPLQDVFNQYSTPIYIEDNDKTKST